MCFVHLPLFERHKLIAEFVQYSFMVYNHSNKGFIYYDVSNKHFHISRNVIFFYNQFMFPCISPAMNDIVTLPKFSTMPQSIVHYKLGHVYVRKHKQHVPTPLPKSDLPLNLVLDPPLDLVLDPPLDPVLDLPLDLVLVEPHRYG